MSTSKNERSRPNGRLRLQIYVARLLLGRTDLADGGAALGAGALGHRTAILRRDLLGIDHFALGLALHAITFHEYLQKNSL